MKKVEIAAYGAPEEVAHCVEAPDLGSPVRERSCSTCSPFRSTRPICRSAAAVTGFAPEFPATPGAECVGRVRAVGAGVSDLKPGDLVINHAARELGAGPPGARRGRDPDPGRARPLAGRDAAHQPADRAAAARRPCRAAARRLRDPECREFGGRPAYHRARQGARRAHDQCRAPRRRGRGTARARRRRGDPGRPRSAGRGRARPPAARRSGSASTRFRARRRGASPTASPTARSSSITARCRARTRSSGARR